MPGRVRILARKSPAIRYAKFGEHQYVGSLKTTVTSGPSTCTWSIKPSLTNGSPNSGSRTSAIAAPTWSPGIAASGGADEAGDGGCLARRHLLRLVSPWG